MQVNDADPADADKKQLDDVSGAPNQPQSNNLSSAAGSTATQSSPVDGTNSGPAVPQSPDVNDDNTSKADANPDVSDPPPTQLSALKQQLKTMTDIMMDLISENRTLRIELKSIKKDDKDQKDDDFDVDALISLLLTANNLQRGTKIKMESSHLKTLCSKVSSLFLSEKSLLKLSFDNNRKYICVGPLNGNFYDLLYILKTNGLPDTNPNINYMFLGNYVNRGSQSLETISLLFALKLKYPQNVYLLRGNHESAAITRFYGFHKELKELNMIELYNMFIDVFECLPVAATIDNKIFCVCGGISPKLDTLQDIENIKRPIQIPVKGLLTDLLWSDPVEDDHDNFVKSIRGAGHHYGPKQVTEFCEKFKFSLIIRGLKFTKNGYEKTKCGRVITIFSIPNYCGTMDNDGAFMTINKELKKEFITLPRVNKK